eukprot:353044-Chlamydomonas_euryale.AAC.4
MGASPKNVDATSVRPVQGHACLPFCAADACMEREESYQGRDSELFDAKMLLLALSTPSSAMGLMQ